MDGTPVWLASLSRRDVATGRAIPSGRWSPSFLTRATGVLREAIGTAGDPNRERLFRMNLTLCLHRAATDAEVAALPAWFHAASALDIAGGPVAVLWETVPGRPSTRPCERPGRQPIPGSTDRDLWLPVDCRQCEPCRARARL